MGRPKGSGPTPASFKKGHKCGGRPKAFAGFREWAKGLIEQGGGKEQIQRRAMDPEDKEQPFFLKLLVEYAYGKAPQPISNDERGPLVIDLRWDANDPG